MAVQIQGLARQVHGVWELRTQSLGAWSWFWAGGLDGSCPSAGRGEGPHQPAKRRALLHAWQHLLQACHAWPTLVLSASCLTGSSATVVAEETMP